MLDNLSEQTTAEKSASKTAQDIKSLRKQGMATAAVHAVLCCCTAALCVHGPRRSKALKQLIRGHLFSVD